MWQRLVKWDGELFELKGFLMGFGMVGGSPPLERGAVAAQRILPRQDC